ncbi:MAG: selenocysteine-specific translation elongation factor [bacterium]|nr:MAG: selenocysteine-specific translation elongation factor [bacterium]
MTTQGHIIIGTAGHIDHGKTSLVKVLTGIDTDRLKEEKERGITIELGFAPLTLPSGMRLGLVDVPGHERFVRNMVAGATGIDLVLLVIAADEGVMPQTREHLDICQLLGVREGVVALTKSDMVEKDWLEMVAEDVREYLAGTFLQDAPIIPFSAVTGSGSEEITAAVQEAAGRIPGRTDKGIFRLPADRVFTMKGFGTVVTGTLTSGKISTGEEIFFLPGDKKAKLRGLQVHGESVDQAAAGTRTALNLQGIDKDEVHRGQTAVREGTLLPTLMLDARVRLLGSAPRPLKNRERVRLHLFTAEIMTRVTILQGEVIQPGEEGLIQLRLEEPTVALPGDRFVIRSYSPMTTIGGGNLIDPLPRKHRRNRQRVIDHLSSLEGGDAGHRVLTFLHEAGEYGMEGAVLSVRTGLEMKDLTELLSGLSEEGKVVVAGKGEAVLVYSAAAFDGIKDRLVKALEKFHQANPARAGIGREELRMRVARQLPDRPYRNLLAALQEQGSVTLDGDTVRMGSHEASLTPEQEVLAGKVLNLLGKAKLSSPFSGEMAEELKASVGDLKSTLNLLADRGDLVRIKDDYFISSAAHAHLMKGVQDYFESRQEMALSDFREIVDTTRKWMIPLLEYLDRTQVTMRKGDVRIKRRSAKGNG